jgi:hypothetical protein
MDAILSFDLASGLSWASGFRLYATILKAELLAKYQWINIPSSLKILNEAIIYFTDVLVIT